MKLYSCPGTDIQARNPFTIHGDLVTMELTQGKSTDFDLADLPVIAPHRWCVRSSNGKFYAASYETVNAKRKCVHLHRVVLGAGGFDGQPVDHINGNGLDNRSTNLRLSTNTQNCQNQARSKNNTSGYIGVSAFKQTGRFSAYLQDDGVKKHLGYFGCPTVAALARDKAAHASRGQFARLNFPELKPNRG